MRKKLISIILCLCMMLSLVPYAFASDSSDFVYEQSPYGPFATIVAYTGSATNLVIPDTIDGYKVTSIGDEAFVGCDSLESVVLPEGLITIGLDSFQGCINLKTVSLPESLTKIEDYSFADCEKLNSITIPKAVSSIGNYAFASCRNLNEVYINSEKIAGIIIDIYTPGDIFEFADVVGFKSDIASVDNYITSNFEKLEDTTGYKSGYELYYTHIHPGFEFIEGPSATCVSDGLTWGEKCTDCDFFNVPQEVIPATGHSFTDWLNVRFASCSETGEEFRECRACGEIETRVTPATHDIMIAEGHEPTCTTDGLTEGQFCSICYEELAPYAIIPALGHDIVNHEAQPATCDTIGWDAYETCARCDYTTYEEIPALGHDIVKHEAQAPTTTTVGWDEYETCTRCNHNTYAELPMLEMILGDTDMNEVVNILDAINIVKYISGWYDNMEEKPIDLAASDVNKDGSTNVLDAIYIVKHIAGHEGYPL